MMLRLLVLVSLFGLCLFLHAQPAGDFDSDNPTIILGETGKINEPIVDFYKNLQSQTREFHLALKTCNQELSTMNKHIAHEMSEDLERKQELESTILNLKQMIRTNEKILAGRVMIHRIDPLDASISISNPERKPSNDKDFQK